MKLKRLSVVLGAGLAIIAGCSQSAKQSSKTNKSADANAASTATGTGTVAVASDPAASNDADGFYTGFDGKSKLSLLLPSFRGKFTIADPSIAKIESIPVTLSEGTITELTAKFKKDNPTVDVANFAKQFTRKKSMYKITPLKAGTTKLTSSSKGGNNPWGKGQNLVLVVADYSADDVATGKARYEREGDGNKRACKSCHETGESGAPPHELGRVMEESDASVLQWVKTGKTATRTAKIQHTWEFDSPEEEKGIVAYLRTKQTDDVETLTKLEFENGFANRPKDGGGPGGPGGPGAGGPPAGG